MAAEKKTSEFNKVLSAWDILVLAFGAMIGWGWVVSSGDWIESGGVIGAMIGFAIGGVMVYFVGLTYAELTSAMPQCGGEHAWSFAAMGPVGSYVCTWMIILGYASVSCFEACALPTIIQYIFPGFMQGYLYTVAGFDVYASWLVTAVIVAAVILAINIRGVETAARVQSVLTIIIAAVGILLIAGSFFSGSTANLEGQMFLPEDSGGMLKGIIAVALVTPFFYIGFDVIPQAAEEINTGLKRIGRILILSIVCAVVFYALIILGVGLLMSPDQISASMSNGAGLVTAEAMGNAFGSDLMSKVLIVGGMAGVVTSWNSFLIGGSRALYSMGESYMVPRVFSRIHPKFKTPVAALLLIGGLSMLAPFFGRKMLVWVVDAGNFGCVAAYLMVAVSFLILRKRRPDMARPYKVKRAALVGGIAVVMAGAMLALYLVPGSPAALVPQEWVIVGGWLALGAVFFVICKVKYGEKFGTEVELVLSGELEQKAQAELDEAFELALSDVRKASGAAAPAAAGAVAAAGTGLVAGAQGAAPALGDFSYFLPVNVQFGWGKIDTAGAVTAAYGKHALLVCGGSSVKKSGLLDRVQESLGEAGVSSVVFDEVAPNPLKSCAEKGAALAKAQGCDVVFGLGGGSVMDCAKAIAFMACNEGDVFDYIYGRKTGDAALPIVLAPTTCGTGSEGNGFAVLTDDETGDKKSLRTNAIVARASIVDPQLMTTLPRKALASVGFDALCHSIEAYTSRRAQPLTDALALYAIGIVARNLPELCDGSQDRRAWEEMAVAATIGGIVINTAGVTLGHGMEHPASGKRDIVHGQGLAALEPVVVEASYTGDPVKFGTVSRLLGGYAASDCADKLRGLLHQIGLEVTLGDLGVKEQDIPWMADNCLKVSAANVENNPVVFTRDQIADLYRKAL